MFACRRPKWKSPCVSLTCGTIVSFLFLYRFILVTHWDSHFICILPKMAMWCNTRTHTHRKWILFSSCRKLWEEQMYLCALLSVLKIKISSEKKKFNISWNYIYCWWDKRKNKICSLLIWNLFRKLFKSHTHKLHRIGNEVYSSKFWINLVSALEPLKKIVCCIS